MHTLCIVDDEPIIREGLASLPWAEAQIKVVACLSNGLEAIETLQSEVIDVILADIRMPGLDGLGLCRFVAANSLNTAVVLLSGHSDFAYAQEAISLGVSAYLLKPSTPEEIIEAVSAGVQQVVARRETDTRLRLLESELGRQRLADQDGELVLGTKPHGDACEAALTYLRERYTEQISLGTMSEALHFSTIYLSRVLKRATDHTFLEILNALRLQHAARLLRATDQSFTEIAAAVGANDARYFGQVFRKAYSVTPMAYRRCPVLPRDEELHLFASRLAAGDVP